MEVINPIQKIADCPHISVRFVIKKAHEVPKKGVTGRQLTNMDVETVGYDVEASVSVLAGNDKNEYVRIKDVVVVGHGETLSSAQEDAAREAVQYLGL